MPIHELLIREFDNEMANTRKTLERVPAEKWDWKPHEKCGTLGWMAGHVATLPGFTTVVLKTPELDIAGITIPKVERHADLLDTFERFRQEARAALAVVSDEQFQQSWALKEKGRVIFSMPRYDALRTMCFNHIVHHRAQLTMYLRLLDVAVPALYGPSADEKTF
ncbi:MAG: DinB family protein [Acidobacteriia bacterium]|nr:DinB family protein [Terriglobia bacterium]